MLTRQENELITRVGPGTPMGEVWRRFWIPALLASELPSPDCPPVRVRLLGEDLIAFRDTAGTVGLVANNCPHRGASLFFGRNEEHGLRCVYHGWKFDAGGTCVDMPNEPAESNFKSKVRLTAYPCRERAGVVWAYLGPAGGAGELPGMEWTLVPDPNRYVGKVLVECNYLQVIEGDLDNSHAAFLHGRLGGAPNDRLMAKLDAGVGLGLAPGRAGALEKARRYAADRAPKGIVQETDFGIMMGWRREAGAEGYYWTINHWMIPSYTMIASPPGSTLLCNVQIPVDDHNTWYYRVQWNADRPLNDQELDNYRGAGSSYPELIPGTFRPKENKDNDYLIDRAAQRTVSFSGIKSITQQDRGVQESMGSIVDRTREHLATSDTVVIAVRRRLQRLARAMADGVAPYAAGHGSVYAVRPVDVVLPRDANWTEAVQPHIAVAR